MHGREINSAGLPGLYRTILATAGPEISSALEVQPASFTGFGQELQCGACSWVWVCKLKRQHDSW